MVKSAKKVVLIVVLAAALIASAFMFVVKSGVFAANETVFATEYDVGERITAPSKTLSFNGESKNADVKIIFPSGSAIKNNTVVLSESGRYTIEYSADFNGETVKEREYVFAYDELYSFSGEKSSAYYGLDNSQYGTGKTALNMNLVSGETVTFNKIIDLKQAKNGFVEFYFTPATRGTAEVQGVYFTLTDVYNPDNKVTFQFKNVAYLGSSYVYLAAYVCAGFNNEAPRAYTYDPSDKVWRLRINDKFGTSTNLTLYGWAEDYGGTPVKDTSTRFYLDLDTKKASLSDGAKGKTEIIDMDNPSYFDTLWEGFTTGEVRLSIEGYQYTGQDLHINITDVFGYDFASGEKITDTEAPEISVMSGDYGILGLPDGSVGHSYPVFYATAFDKVSGEVPVTVKAFYGYDAQTQIELNIEDEYVSTAREGKYKIVYTAKDAFGNVAEKTLNFYVNAQPIPITINFTGEYETSCKQGEAIKLPIPEYSGGSGDLSTRVFVDGDCAYDTVNNILRILDAGVTTVSFIAEDMTGYVVEKSYQVTVSKNSDPVVLENVVLPEYLFGGQKYAFPKVSARDFTKDEDVSTEVYVDGVLCADGTFTPEDKAGTELQPSYNVVLEYKVNGKSVLSKPLTVLDVKVSSGSSKNYKVEGFWTSEDFTATSSSIGVELYNEKTGDLSASLAKPILYGNFSIGAIVNDDTAIDGVTITVTDYENPFNFMTISLVKTADNQTAIFVNGIDSNYKLSNNALFTKERFNISVVNGYLQDGGSVNMNIDGLFTAEKVILTLTADGVKKASENSLLTIVQVGGTALTSRTTRDQIAPVVITEGSYPNYAEKGESLTVYRIIAEDLLDTFVTAEVSVVIVKADGTSETLLSKANAFVENFVTISDYGTITVSYSVKDGSGNERKPFYNVSVVDTTDPVITFNGKVVKTAKVGETLTFEKATAKDGNGNDLKVKYFVLKPSVSPVMLGENMQFTPTWAGTYVYRLYVEDSNGNVAYKDFTFIVR